jgi:RNA polymerase sigma-70 factor (ECF subfamily)
LRKQKNRHHVDVDDPVHEGQEALQVDADAEQAVDARDRRQRIAAALDQVPETLRIPLVMCDLDEMPYQEIADTLGIGLSAAKMRIKRGREAFREAYERMDP